MNDTYKYTVISVDLGLSLVTVDIELSDGSLEEVNIDIRQIAVSDDDTELQLKNALHEVITQYIQHTFPKPPPRPTKLENLTGYSAEIEF